MKTIFIALLSLITLGPLSFSPEHHQQYTGTDCRGQVLYYNTYYQQWAPYTATTVDLWESRYVGNDAYGQPIFKWFLIAESISGNDGFYYFYGILPGNYTIQVSKTKNFTASIIMIDYRYYRYQDLPVIYY